MQQFIESLSFLAACEITERERKLFISVVLEKSECETGEGKRERERDRKSNKLKYLYFLT